MLKIVITLREAHPHFAGDKNYVYEFPIEKGVEASKKYYELLEADRNNSGYSHTTIQIVESMTGER